MPRDLHVCVLHSSVLCLTVWLSDYPITESKRQTKDHSKSALSFYVRWANHVPGNAHNEKTLHEFHNTQGNRLKIARQTPFLAWELEFVAFCFCLHSSKTFFISKVVTYLEWSVASTKCSKLTSSLLSHLRIPFIDGFQSHLWHSDFEQWSFVIYLS